VRHAEQENVAIRAAARAAAVAALEAGKTPKPLPSQHAAFASSTPAGTGQFAAVGFSYGSGGAASDDGDESAEEAEEEDDSDDDLPATAGACLQPAPPPPPRAGHPRPLLPAGHPEAAAWRPCRPSSPACQRARLPAAPHRAPPLPRFTAEDADMDRCALREFGIEEFSSMLRWAMRQEAEEAAANARRTRRNWSRKKARLRWGAGRGAGRERGIARHAASLSLPGTARRAFSVA
jgi:hypothetical protein